MRPENPLFIYGTLQDPAILRAVLGRTTHEFGALRAVAPGWAAVFYPGRSYPGLVRAPGGAAEGLLLFGLTMADLVLLDSFEGAEYRRNGIAVMIDTELHQAQAYLPAIAMPADAAPWSLAAWQARHGPASLDADTRSAAELRQRMILLGPR